MHGLLTGLAKENPLSESRTPLYTAMESDGEFSMAPLLVLLDAMDGDRESEGARLP
jgi:hypothetical protein